MNKLTLTKGVRTKRVLQNTSWIANPPQQPTIQIVEGEKTWAEAYSNWLDGKPPTNSPEWKNGIFLHFEPIVEEELPPPANSQPTLISYIIVGCKLLVISVLCIGFTLVVKSCLF